MKGLYQKLNLFLIVFGVVILAIISTGNILAQDPINVTDQEVDYNFRESVTFTASAESSAEIVEANLFYQVVGQVASSRNAADFEPGTTVEAEFVIDETDPSNYLPPGTELQYWWGFVDAEGNELKTEKKTLLYLDNRYDWQTLDNERLTLYWYEGGDDFGQALFDRANAALDTLETDVGVVIEDPIKIFIYANHRDFLGAISASAQEWTGGQAFTRFGVVAIGIAPGQLDWGLNAMTHEMTHLVIHQATENPFGDLPRWLDEGIAVYNENQDELDDDFRAIFERAVQNNELMTLRTLSSPFPSDPLQANLAYGESGAVVKYMVDTYGPDKMAALLEIFSEGALYDEALEQALGVNTDQLDNEFRASLGLPPLPGTESSAAAAESVTSAEDTQEGDAAKASEQVKEPVVESQEPAGSTAEEAVASAATPAQTSSETSESNNAPFGLSCLAGLLFLVLVGGARLVLSGSR
jgi:hypothetical protein